MSLKELMKEVVEFFTPPSFMTENDKRRASTLYFLLFLLLGTFSLLIIIPITQKLTQDLYALLAADAIILVCLLLTRLGHITITSYLVSFGLLVVNTVTLFYGKGTNDITILGLPVIIAMGGLLLGKNGALTLAGSSIVCVFVIAWAEINGLTPNTGDFAKDVTLSDVIVIALLLITSAALIYFIMNSLSRSLESTLNKEHSLQKANDNLQHYATIMEQRNKQLLTGAIVAHAASTILEPDVLCQEVVDMVCERFGLYYVGLFLSDPTEKWAVLYAGTGEAGKAMLKKKHRLKVGSTSMIGWCIANRSARIALDVGKDAVRFDNPLLPDTRSELALPLISRSRVIGALGIQSDLQAAFSEEDITTFQAMADQLANSISNAQLYDQLQRELLKRERVEKMMRKMNRELEKRVAARTHELMTANENLTALSHLKDEFIANVSHELRTPLTSIMLYHDMLKKQPEALGKYISHLKRETDRLANLIENLLYLSRLDQGYTAFNPVQLDLNQLVEEYVNDRTPLAEKRHLKLTLQKRDHIPLISADEQMTGQVFSAILTNAINYTPSGGSITVATMTEESLGKVWSGFLISDTGPGIPHKDQERLFERFYRGETGRESTAPGTGLGLAIAREIVNRHGGRIEVQSTGIPGKGTTFLVWLQASA